jgi:Tfp pilus assembly protein PilO
MNINLRDPQTQVWVLLGLLLAAAGLVYLYILQPILTDTEKMRQEIVSLQGQINQLQAIERKLPQYIRELNLQEQRLAELKTALPDEKETAEIIKQVQQFAIAARVHLKAFRPQNVIPKDLFTEWPIQMEFDGFYNSLGIFFEKIAKHSRILNVSNLTIRRINNSEDPQKTLTATCITTTFVLKP